MAFDASPLATIGDNFDPTAAKAKAYQLKDLLDEQQLNQLKLGQEKQKAADTATARKIFSKGDISTAKGMMETAQSLNKAGLSDQAMGLIKEAQSSRQAEEQFTETHLQILQTSADILGPTALQIAQTFQTQGPAMARAQYQAQVGQILPQLPEELRQKIPAQPPQDDQQFMQLLQGAINQSKQAREIISSHLAQKKEETAEAKESETERHNRATEENAGRRTDITAKKATAAESAGMEPEDLKFAAQQYLAGDKSVFSGLGRGTQGAANILALRKAVRQEAEARGMNGADVAAKMAEFNAIMAEERKIGGIAGGVEFASAELGKFIPLAEQASAAVPRGKFVPFNQLVQLGESKISDPALRRLYVNTQGVLNAYDVLAARGGTDASKREHNRQLLTTADSQEVYKTALDAMQQELAVAKGASGEARSNVASELSGSSKPATAPKQADTAVKPYSDPDKERRYQEWKKQHGGG